MNTFEISPFRLEGDVWLILDQTRLPGTEVYLRPETKEDIWHAINTLQVRGAPAIGIAAAYGLWLSVKDFTGSMEEFAKTLQAAKDYLVTARPTAVNLAWALERMWNTWRKSQPCDIITSKDLLFAEAKKIYEEDVAACKAMGEYGLTLLKPGMGILTHCNAGALATSKYGTCLAPIHLGQERGYNFHVFSDETRPLLQGARLTCWELQKSGVDVTLICDNMAASAMKQGKIDAVVVGCDRMAANGDGANKIGTSGVAVLAKEYGIPGVVTGFEPVDVLQGIAMIMRQLHEGRAEIEIAYARGVMPQGNPVALAAIDEVFETRTATWRGLGDIPGSGYRIREEFAQFDALKRFQPEIEPTINPKGCRCGDVLRARMEPSECPLFRKVCTPENPVGPCMVSSEGSCAAYYRYY